MALHGYTTALSHHISTITLSQHYHGYIQQTILAISPDVLPLAAHPLRHQPSNKAREAHVTELHVALPRAKAAKGAPILGDVNLGKTQPPMNTMWVL